ncbi:MAG: glycosyltransferase family 2 protein [Planctomycetota bacterium]
MDFLGSVVTWAGVLLCLPTYFLLLEVVAGLPKRREHAPSGGSEEAEVDAVLLIPAHDEGLGMARILERLLPSVEEGVRPIVIADNCTDDTAAIAREAGVEVWERDMPDLRGKPQALAWAFERLQEQPPEVVLIVDADTWFSHGGPLDLALAAKRRQKPVQAINRIDGSGLRDFAFRFRNEARLNGLANFGAPTQLSGTGFAMPWTLLQDHPLPLGELAEDASWGWELTMAGHGTYLHPEVAILSAPPQSKEGERTQVRRWEHGILAATMRYLPRLLFTAVVPLRPRRFLHALDVAVPPLALLVLSCLAVGALGLVVGEVTVLAPVASALCAMVLAVLLGWWRYGREDLPFTQLLRAPFYALAKLGLYVGFVFKREKGWKRTERDAD